MSGDVGEEGHVATLGREPSTDGVSVAVHHLAPQPAPTPLLIAHATGFHGRAYLPLAIELASAFDVWAHDVRGHGATPPAETAVRWEQFGEDAAAAARHVAAATGNAGEAATAGLVGFGHSLGGGCLLMAAHANPSMFRALVLFEPIAVPPGVLDGRPNRLAERALRRRREFPSALEAEANFASKPPMNRFHPEALRQYVAGGVVPIDPSDPGGAVRLSCTPEHESVTFRAPAGSRAWGDLAAIGIPVAVIGGRTDTEDPPSLLAEAIAAELPGGRYLPHPELDHFGPFVDPAATAAATVEALAELDASP